MNWFINELLNGSAEDWFAIGISAIIIAALIYLLVAMLRLE